MPIIVQQQGPEPRPTVASVLAKIQQDVRQMLTATGNETLLLDYLNRVHTKILRVTEWRFLLEEVQSFSTVIGASKYWIGPTASCPADAVNTGLDIQALWRIKQDSVANATVGCRLSRVGEAPIGVLSTIQSPPAQYRNDVASPFVIGIYPIPDKVYTINFRYFAPRYNLTTGTDEIQIPADYEDILVAGINELACIFLKRFDDANYWHQQLVTGRNEMLRDTRGFGDLADYMHGDPLGNTKAVTGTILYNG